MITASVVGAGAGLALVVVELALGDDLEHVESAAVGVAVMGLALTAYDTVKGRDDAAVGVYWGIAALAGVPAVVAYWMRRKAQAARALALESARIAGKDYRVPGAAA